MVPIHEIARMAGGTIKAMTPELGSAKFRVILRRWTQSSGQRSARSSPCSPCWSSLSSCAKPASIGATTTCAV